MTLQAQLHTKVNEDFLATKYTHTQTPFTMELQEVVLNKQGHLDRDFQQQHIPTSYTALEFVFMY